MYPRTVKNPCFVQALSKMSVTLQSAPLRTVKIAIFCIGTVHNIRDPAGCPLRTVIIPMFCTGTVHNIRDPAGCPLRTVNNTYVLFRHCSQYL